MESDPIGLLGGLNTYAYVAGDPLLVVDPSGLIEWSGSIGVGAMGFGGTGGGSVSAGIITGGGNVCYYEQACVLLGYGFAAGAGFEAGIGVGQLCTGVYRSVGGFGVLGRGLISGGSIMTSGSDVSGGAGFGGVGAGAAAGGMGCITRLTCLNPCQEDPCE